jgi:hypothetical protein
VATPVRRREALQDEELHIPGQPDEAERRPSEAHNIRQRVIEGMLFGEALLRQSSKRTSSHLHGSTLQSGLE